MGNYERSIHNRKVNREMFIDINVSGDIINITENCTSFLGYKKENIIGKNINIFSLKIIQLDFLINKIEKVFPFKNSRGEKIYLDIKVIDRLEDVIVLSLINVTNYKKNEIKLDSFLKIFENSKDIIYSLQVKPEIKFIYISPSIKENLGYTVEENMENPILCCEATHPDFKELQYRKVDKNTDFSKPIVTRIMSKITGDYVWQEDFVTPFFDDNGNLIKVNGVCREIQETKELEEKLTYVSYHDSLTDLYNRTYLDIKMCEYNNCRDEKIGIAIFDLDKLKEINDRFGHKTGDILIKEAGLLIKVILKDHIVCRFGGDEFVVIFEYITLENMEEELRKLTEGIEKYNCDKSNLKINMSMGYAHTNNSRDNTNRIFKIADDNMYSNKDIRKLLGII
ncbi:diguanylate cyclase [Clostridium sp.]|uniref:diguanylate cyclase domain-containing protein n=1 Tax=Clostridium sp. TaxID=1506 RepID=UPI00261BEEE9|nr:diguanylate cyclase [Clostridium sp.]